MRPISVVAILLAVVVTSGLFIAQPALADTGDDGKLTIPWDEFKKLINLDADEIVIPMETFQKLLAQTGTHTPPPHTVSDGNVVLSREEFMNLIDRMKPHSDPGATPPFPHLLTKAVYSGEMGTTSTDFTAVYTVHVLQREAYVRVPILPSGIALADIRVDGEPALVVVENGYHNVVLPAAGEYEVTATYSVASSLEKGPHKIDLTIRQAPITLLTLRMPLTDIDVEIPQAQQVITRERDDATIVSAVIGQGGAVSIRWRKEVAATEKIPPKIYSEVHHLIAIQDDALRTNSIINYTILHSEVDAVRVVIPERVNVLSVSGEGVGEWQETGEGDERVIIIPFTYGKKGNTAVHITTEVASSESGLASVFAGLRTLDTVRETGFLGVELATSAEVIAKEDDGLEKLPVEKLPASLANRSARPLIMGFKYLKHSYSLVFDITKHEKIAVPVATINSASVVTLFTEDGKIVHRLVYQVRNSAKQFLEIQLPDEADVWSVFVGGQPVESSMNRKGKLLVPLIRSRSVNNRLDAFPVEVIYAKAQNRFSPFGSLASTLPSVDVLTSQLIWSVYLPNDYSYLHFKSTLEKEEMIRGVNVLARAPRKYDEDAMRRLRQGGKEFKDKLEKIYKGNDYSSSFRNIPMEEAQITGQLDAELEFGGRLEGLASGDTPQAPVSGGAMTTGVLPIQVRVPTGGQVYRFARTIIRPEDPLEIDVVYTRMWVIGLLKWIVVAIVLLVIWLNRKRLIDIGRWTGGRLIEIAGWVKHREDAIRRYAQSIATPFVLIGLIIVLRSISETLTMLCILLFWVSVAWHGIRLWRKRMQMRTTAKIPAQES